MKYTEDQEKAITTRNKNILVAAAAGSGKTRVLVDRIIRQLTEPDPHEEKPPGIENMLIVTFTNAAAAEMRGRIRKALEKALENAPDSKTAEWLDRQIVLLPGASISTFHSFCQKIIRRHIDALDIDPQFRLAGDEEMALLRRDTLESVMEDLYDAEDSPGKADFLHFVDDYGSDHGDEPIYDAVLQLARFAESQPCPLIWLEQQENEPVPATLADVLSAPSMTIILDEIEQGIRDCRAGWEAIPGIVPADAEPALQDAWSAYIEVANENLAVFEDLEGDLTALRKGRIDWDTFAQKAGSVKFAALSGAKKFKVLKDDYPKVRAAFEERRDAVQKTIWGNLQEKCIGKRTKTKDEIMTGDMILEDAQGSRETVRRYAALTRTYLLALQAAKKEKNILDFSDLEHFALQVLTADPEKLQANPPVYEPSEAALTLREQYKIIMVDEYQDTNAVQEALVRLIASERNRFIVGDVKQSIYRFRLADPGLFQHKFETYPADPGDGPDQLITMNQNFRSRAEVLEPINFIFRQVMTKEAAEIEYDEQAELHPGAVYPEETNSLKSSVELDLLLPNDAAEENADVSDAKQDEAPSGADDEELKGFEAEADFVAERIGKLLESGRKVFDKDLGSYRPLACRDIAILMRAVTGKSALLLEALRRHSIPAYADVDGGYFEAAEVRLMVMLLRVLDNVRQDIPLAAVLASPIGGFTMEELARIRLTAPNDSLYEALLKSYSPDSLLDADLADRAREFQEDVAAWRDFAVNHGVMELIWKLYRETGYYNYVGSLPGGLLRQANLRMLADRAAEYEKTNYRGLFRFLRYIEDLRRRETDLAAARTLGESEDVVRIMSIHKSKGLEFPVVIVADLGKGFNLKNASGTFLFHQDLGIGCKLVERSEAGRQIFPTAGWRAVAAKITAESKAEEMRVLYVALTRAREKLILTGALTPGRFENSLKTWARLAASKEPSFAARDIAAAGNYLDWIAPAVLRHPDAGELVSRAKAEDRQILDAKQSAFTVHIIDLGGRRAEKAAQPDDELLQAVREGKLIPSSEKKDKVEARLNWKYDTRGLDDVPAKLSVSELKQRFRAGEDKTDVIDPAAAVLVPGESAGIPSANDASVDVKAESSGIKTAPVSPDVNVIAEKRETVVTPVDAGTALIADDRDWPRPQFLQEEKKLTAAERGTILHSVMQHLDLRGDLTFHGVKNQLARMEEQGILLPEERETVYIKGVTAFLSSDLGKRLQNATQVWRELPFSRLLNAHDFYPEVRDPEASVFVQGVIDVLFEEQDGGLVLLDYKTDRPMTDEAALAKYELQLTLYRAAVEELTGRTVKETWLYLLTPQRAVAVPRRGNVVDV